MCNTNKVDYRMLFLKKDLIGQKVNLNVPDEVLDGCISLAYNDMNVGCRFYKLELVKEDEIKRVKNILRSKSKIVFNINLIDTYEKELSVYTRRIPKVTSFGLAQKLINMTFKYFYVYEEYLKGYDIDFSNCDCPLDSNILEKIGRSELKWTQMNKTDYSKCQDYIREMIKEDPKVNKEMSKLKNLAYDFIYW